MPDSQANLKIFTLDEANALLPQVRLTLAQLRRAVTQLLAQEATVDAVEMITEQHNASAWTHMTTEVSRAEERKHVAQEAFEAFDHLGCHLKDLDAGLVDFYSVINGELALLCWHEGEDAIRYWHAIDDGLTGRQPIPGT